MRWRKRDHVKNRPERFVPESGYRALLLAQSWYENWCVSEWQSTKWDTKDGSWVILHPNSHHWPGPLGIHEDEDCEVVSGLRGRHPVVT